MYMRHIPEDSVLSRHFEGAVEMQRQIWLQKPPSDSILRRHAMSPGSHPTYGASTATDTRPSPAAQRASSSAAPVRQTAAEEKGFFARLFGLFSHRA